MAFAERLLVGLAALAGASGVALAAAAAHGGGANLAPAAQMLLVHAPALLAVAALTAQGWLHRPLTLLAGFALALGVLLFSGTLVLGALYGIRPFPMAAPTGGVILIGGWLLLVPAALLRWR
jgi:uncharacterized membrane protein YgdD (TMEM256/DUF423 family)